MGRGGGKWLGFVYLYFSSAGRLTRQRIEVVSRVKLLELRNACRYAAGVPFGNSQTCPFLEQEVLSCLDWI